MLRIKSKSKLILFHFFLLWVVVFTLYSLSFSLKLRCHVTALLVGLSVSVVIMRKQLSGNVATAGTKLSFRIVSSRLLFSVDQGIALWQYQTDWKQQPPFTFFESHPPLVCLTSIHTNAFLHTLSCWKELCCGPCALPGENRQWPFSSVWWDAEKVIVTSCILHVFVCQCRLWVSQ